MANNEIGTIEPIKEIVDICHLYGATLHTDAVQAIGHININVRELGVDLLSASAHKFNGPKGIGFLYVRKGVQLFPLINGGSQEFSMRAGTENVPSIVGMATALQEAILGLNKAKEKLLSMEDLFYKTLDKQNVEYIRNGDKDNHLPGLINVSFKNISGETILHRLDLMGIYISTGSACDGEKNQISHVIKAIDVNEDYAKGTIRISFGKNNVLGDARKIALAIIKILTEKK